MLITDSFTDALILVVDDEPANVHLLERILARAGYTNLLTTTRPQVALEHFRKHTPDLVLLDLKMPVMDGYTLLEEMGVTRADEDFLPVVVLTGDLSLEARERALSAGATDFITKPFHPSEVLLRIRNLLHTRRIHLELRDENRVLGRRVVQQERELAEAQAEVLERLAQAVETRDGETGLHTRRVGDNSARVARELGFQPDAVELIKRAAPLHDVGKLGVPDSILLKPARLTPDEYEIAKSHTTIGARMLARGSSRLMKVAEHIAHAHHERWNGEGYPRELAGEDIPMEARIVSVVDYFDALAHDRPYREAWPEDKILGVIEAKSGQHFDPDVVDAFMRAYDSGHLMI